MNFESAMTVGGFGQVSPQDFQALQTMLRKALTAGYGTPAVPLGSEPNGAALIPQSIEAALAVAEFDVRKEVRLFPKLFKGSSISTVHEYSRIGRYGSDFDPFIQEGALPPEDAGVYTRAFQTIKYMATLRRVTDVMASVKILGGDTDAIALETRMGTAHLLGQIEASLFWADHRVNTFAYDGLKAILEINSPTNIVDLRGAVLTEEVIRRDIAQAKERFYVSPDAIWTSFSHQQILGVLRGGNQRYVDTDGNSQVTSGVTVRDVPTAVGPLLIEPDVFLRVKYPNPLAVGDSAPTIAAMAPFTFVAGAPVGPEVSLFGAADAGNYIYRVVAVGPNGRSAPRDSGATAVVAGQKVTITLGAGALNDITYFEIYRTPVGGLAASATLIGGIARVVGGNTIYTDLNNDLPGTSWAFALSYDPTIFEFIRLLDLMYRPLPFYGLATAFAILLFGTPLSRTPSKLYAWKNVAQTA